MRSKSGKGSWLTDQVLPWSDDRGEVRNGRSRTAYLPADPARRKRLLALLDKARQEKNSSKGKAKP